MTAEQKGQYERDGYIKISGLIGEALLARLQAAIELLQTKVNSQPGLYKTRYMIRREDEFDTWGVEDVFSPELYDEAFGDYLGDSRLLSTVRSILGEELRFWTAHALWEPKIKSYDLEWHRDGVSYTPLHNSTHVLFNLTLEPEASLIVLPGSHNRQLTTQEAEILKTNSTAVLPTQEIVACEVGDIIFMNSWMLHRGQCEAGMKRRVLHFNLQPRFELYGGYTSHHWMREPRYLSAMHPNVAHLMRNLIEWDDSSKSPTQHIQSLRALRLRKKAK